MNEKQTRVVEILAEVLQVQPDAIQPGQDLKADLNIDSAQTLELLSNIEDEFEVEISEVDAAKVSTVQDILDLTERSE